jgi:hypothetical protein
MDKTQSDIAAWVTHKVAEWNNSEILLREVLTIALKKALASGDTHNMPTYELIQSIWLRKYSERTNINGYVMFWSLKEVLHAKPQNSARAILEKINTSHMRLTSNGMVDYNEWVSKMAKLADNLIEYEDNGCSDTFLLDLFEAKYREVIPAQLVTYDKILRMLEEKTLTWNKLLADLDEIALNKSIKLRTLSAITDE